MVPPAADIGIGSFAAFRRQRLAWHGGPAAFDAHHAGRFTADTWRDLHARLTS